MFIPGSWPLAVILAVGQMSSNGQDAQTRPVICIDPGHPSEINNGYTVQNGTTETHIDWVVALRLRDRLQADGYQVVLTKSAERQIVKNWDRAEIANRAGARLMVRLHCDTGPGSGYAIYYPDRQGTRFGVTGPSVAVQEQSWQAAIAMAAAMPHLLAGSLKSGGVRGDTQTLIGGKQGALTGSIFSQVPVITIEMVVLRNRHDAAFIKGEAGQTKMAQAIAEGVEAFVPRTGEKGWEGGVSSQK